MRLTVLAIYLALLLGMASFADSVPYTRTHGCYFVQVQMNGVEVEGLIDTGATDTCIPEDVWEKTKAPMVGISMASLADGNVITSPIVRLRTFTIGGTTIKDLEVSVIPKDCHTLIGEDVLDHIAPWRFDPTQTKMIFGK